MEIALPISFPRHSSTGMGSGKDGLMNSFRHSKAQVLKRIYF